jgi:hypothetical protein
MATGGFRAAGLMATGGFLPLNACKAFFSDSVAMLL